MIVGVPSEVKEDEYRVAITPAGVRELTSAGHTVLVEKGAGEGSSMPDADFQRTGAKIVDDADEVWATADLVCKVKEPVPEEYPRLGARSDQALFTYLHLAAEPELARAGGLDRRNGAGKDGEETVPLPAGGDHHPAVPLDHLNDKTVVPLQRQLHRI